MTFVLCTKCTTNTRSHNMFPCTRKKKIVSVGLTTTNGSLYTGRPGSYWPEPKNIWAAINHQAEENNPQASRRRASKGGGQSRRPRCTSDIKSRPFDHQRTYSTRTSTRLRDPLMPTAAAKYTHRSPSSPSLLTRRRGGRPIMAGTVTWARGPWGPPAPAGAGPSKMRCKAT